MSMRTLAEKKAVAATAISPLLGAPAAGAALFRPESPQAGVRLTTDLLSVLPGIASALPMLDVAAFLGREREGGVRECATPAPPSFGRSLRWLRLFFLYPSIRAPVIRVRRIPTRLSCFPRLFNLAAAGVKYN